VIRRPRRTGFTLLEVVVVLTIILILGAVVAPSLLGFWGENRTKAAVDTVTARLADARGAAIAHARPYRVCLSPDGLQVKVCPDESESAEELTTEAFPDPVIQVSSLPQEVTLTPMNTGTDLPVPADDGWTTLVTFLPDGTCKEEASEFQLSEPEGTPVVVRVRGLTGVWTANRLTAATGGNP
jgi:prepilin-type N-terminal cleavage/methylation domain-containing protein